MIKRIEGTDYLANAEDGTIISINSGINLKPTLSHNGYGRVSIDGVTKSVHRLILSTFVDNPENKSHINHINGDKLDNRLSNLEWVTPQENKNHAMANGLVANGEKINTAVMNEAMALEALEMLSRGISSAEVARKFGVTRATISKLKLGQTWKHLPRTMVHHSIAGFAAKLKAEDIPEIRYSFLEGESNAEIAKRYGVAAGTINQVRIGKTWRNY